MHFHVIEALFLFLHQKEDVLLRDVASSSSLTAVAAVEEPKETTAATKRISRRGTKKPYVEIVQGSEPEKAQGRRTRGRGAKEQESVSLEDLGM